MQRSGIIVGQNGSDRNRGDFTLAAFLLLILGGALRFYHLGALPLGADELQVVLSASKSAASIFSLPGNVESPSPFFYLLYKLSPMAGSSDFWLRFPSAVFGTLSLFCLWLLGERHLENRFSALTAVGILTVHPLHIWISRQVEPYALIVLCFTLAVGFLLEYLSSGQFRHARRSLLASLPMALCHPLGLLILGTQWVVAGASAVFRGVPGLASAWGYGLGAALCASPVAYLLWAAKSRGHEVIDAGPPWENILAALKGTLAFGADRPFAWVILGGLMATGTLALLLRRSLACSLVALFLLPVATLVLTQYSGHLDPVHLSFLLPLAVLLAGAGVDGLAPQALRRPGAVLLACLCLTGAFVYQNNVRFYQTAIASQVATPPNQAPVPIPPPLPLDKAEPGPELPSDAASLRFGSNTLALKESGLESQELSAEGTPMRLSLGGTTGLEYETTEPGELQLSYRFVNRVPGQGVEVLRDGERLAVYEDLEPGQEVLDTLSFETLPGPGRIEFRYASWNHKDQSSTFAPDDPREIAVSFLTLSLEAQDHAGSPPAPQTK